LNDIPNNAEVVITVWDYDRSGEGGFMGYCRLPLEGTLKGIYNDNWYALNQKPAHVIISDKGKTGKIASVRPSNLPLDN
jgi:hypothetical protein